MLFRKKKNLGMKPKFRPIEAVNMEYNQHAAQIGHKAKCVNSLQQEIEQHVQVLLKLEAEAIAINEEAKANPPAVSAQEQKTEAKAGA